MDRTKALRLLEFGSEGNPKPSEIRSAYKRLALKFHPDKNGGEDKVFKELSEAQRILLEPPPPPALNNPFANIYNDFFSGFGHGPKPASQSPPQRSPDKVVPIELTLKDVHTDTIKNFKINVIKVCFSCRVNCVACQGTGEIITKQQIGPFFSLVTARCNGGCQGTGTVREGGPTIACSDCKDKGEISTDQQIQIKVPKCSKTGDTFVIEGLGVQPTRRNGVPGNLIFNLTVATSDDHFTRINGGDDLQFEIEITLLDSIIGTTVVVPCYSEPLVLNTATLGIVNPYLIYRCPNLGLGLVGGLQLKFKIKYPENKRAFSEQDKAVFSAMLT